MTPTAERPTDNHAAAQLEAVLALLFSATDEQDLAKKKRHAAQIAGMGSAEPEEEPQAPLRHGRGDFLEAWRYEAPRVPAGREVSGFHGGQWVQAQALAEFYASLFSDLSEAGSPPDEAQIEGACEEVEPHGWTIEQSEEGFEAVRLEDLDEDGAQGPLQHRRVKKGTPGAIEKTDKRGRHYYVDRETPDKVTSERARAARIARGPVDREKLAARLAPHKEKHKVFRSNDRTAKASVGMLRRHHGELALHRVEELADAAEAALAGVSEGRGHEGLRNRLGKKLAILHRMAELAGGGPDTMTGEGDKHDDLETTGTGSGERGLPPGERLGAGSVPPPGGELSGTDEGTPGDGGSAGLPGGADEERDGSGGATGGPGDAAGSGTSDGTGTTAAGAGGTAPGVGDGIGAGGGDGSGGAATAHEQSLQQPASKENPTDLAAGNWKYPDRNEVARGGLKAKFRDNLEAIRTLRAIRAEGRDTATPAEQAAMAKYVGWGQFKAVFNSYYDREWTKEREQLRGMMTPEEWEAASKSTLNAHYTHPDVVAAHWDMARRLGFDGGRFLETSAGIGYYLGLMPGDLAGKTRSSAVELDPTTGAMLKLLYPAANVKVQGFEKFQSPDNFYDLVASNVPFGDYGVHDPRYNKHQANIHDYFFLKSLDKVRPGGVVMHITSTGTLDKSDSRIRDELAAQGAELVAAIRFPGGTHKENAGTDVVTDMLIIRKKHPGEGAEDLEVTPEEAMPPEGGGNTAIKKGDKVKVRLPHDPGTVRQGEVESLGGGFAHVRDQYGTLQSVPLGEVISDRTGFTGTTVDSLGRTYHWVDGKRVPGPKWNDVVMVPDPAGGEPIPVNRYFAEHPEQVLGTIDRTDSMYHGDSVNVTKTEDYQARLEAAIARLPEGLLKRQTAPKERFSPEAMPAPGDVKEGGYAIRDGKLYVKDKGGLHAQDVDATTLARIQGQLQVRDALRGCLNVQLAGGNADVARKDLNSVYDTFVKKHGPLGSPANKRAFRSDPDSPVVLALEKYDAETKKATKADVFHKDTVSYVKPAEKANDVVEALGISLHEHGRVNIGRMAALLGRTPEEIGTAMVARGLAFEDPSEGFLPADQYLSGNVRRKLAMARAAAETDPRFAANVAALEKVQPEDVDHTEIGVKLGVPWVPSSDVAAFAGHLLEGRPDLFRVTYVPATGKWLADFGNSHSAQWLAKGQLAQQKWATNRADFMDVFEAALNNTSLTIYDKDADGKAHVNRAATDDANAKVQEVKDAFAGWVWEDEERRNRLHRHYNDNFNNIRNISYDGSHQTFPGKNPAIELRDHQKNFIWQVVTTGKGLAAHEVGTGKSFALIAAAMEQRRLGLAKKPAIVCLKANVESITADALKLYPGARILSTADMFDAKSRKETIARIATGDYDMVLLTHDHLDLLQMKPEVVEAHIKGETAEIEAAIVASQKDNPKKNNRIVTQLNKAKARLEKVLNEALDASKKDDAVYFEETGIDSLFVDECFPGDTRVVTAWGNATIREIVQNRLPGPVLSLNRDTGEVEWRPVTGWFERPLRNHLVRVDHECGSFICTPNHNIWTEEDGYVQAGLLQGHHTLRVVPEAVPGQLVEGAGGEGQVLQQALLRQGAVAARREELRAVRPGIQATGQPGWQEAAILLEGVRPQMAVVGPSVEGGRYSFHERGRYRGEAAGFVGADENQEPNELRDSTTATVGRRARLENRVEGSEWEEEGRPLAPPLSLLAGRRVRGASYLDRGGRFHSPCSQGACVRSEKGACLARSRVASVTLHQRAGDERTLCGAEGDSVVFDIEVDGNHNYIANGAVVSNSHKYKSLPVHTGQHNLKGVPTSRSDRATSMLMRARWLQENNSGRGVVFATGTPVANTMAELYTMQKYLQPEDLKERGIDSFDGWAATFGEVETKREFTVSGEYKPVSRFAKFVNIPELTQMVGQVMDVQRADDLKNADGTLSVVRPKRKDAVVVAPKGPAMEALMESLQQRARSIKGRAETGADNMLNICTDGRKGALDMRMLDANAEDDPHSKTNLAVQNVLRLHRANPGKSQLIFSDVGVNPTDQGFHLYGDVIGKLVAGGIPREKIADFSKLEGAKKEAAMVAMRKGDILIGIGSTEKLGTGVNVQDKLQALHHLDVPWLPASVEQRDGRGWRQGNENKEVGIHRYVSEGSLDQTFWQIIGNKTRFIKQVIASKGGGVRSARDEDTEELTPEQLMAAASGDPRVLEKVNLDDEVKHLTAARARHEREQIKFRDTVATTERNLPKLEKQAKVIRQDVQHLDDHPDFSLEVNGRHFDDRGDAADAFRDWQHENPDVVAQNRYGTPKKIGSYRGLDVVVEGSKFALRGAGGELHSTGDSLGSIEAVARNLHKKATEADQHVEAARADIGRIRASIGQAFPKQKDLEERQAKRAALEAELSADKNKNADAGSGSGEAPGASGSGGGGASGDRLPSSSSGVPGHTLESAIMEATADGASSDQIMAHLKKAGLGHVPFEEARAAVGQMMQSGRVRVQAGRAHAVPMQHRRPELAQQYARLAEQAERCGDRASAAIYRRQCLEAV